MDGIDSLAGLPRAPAAGAAPGLGDGVAARMPARADADLQALAGAGFRVRAVTRHGRDGAVETTDRLAEEVPVALVFNGISHAVMLATPADLDDFALGFSLVEGIAATPRDIRGIEAVEGCDGIALEIELAPARFMALKERRRSLAGKTGCGLCGVDSLDALDLNLAPVPRGVPLRRSAIEAALAALPARQPLFAATGAVHAAARALADGSLVAVREDVGRHNALDKLVGHCARRADPDPADGFVLVSSRASYEMVQKTAAAGIGCLVAMSAPTARAAALAERLGVTLCGFARPGRLVVASHPARLLAD
ncbi:formate dehydrogenase accessory sulfurtransferase FdhD [Derxia gummosa]|uniref:Sulfur carrier protein FdhD n=1 Tax=Derxia gummosa DSM 723 TaxID=1121388 RepID=A0A9U5H1H8_9BURK|nr:formate dehydrogenase accessory sulfurtransferase FdhD [Derxia gummosa]